MFSAIRHTACDRIRDWKHDVQFAAYRERQAKRGVFVDRRALLRGLNGIEIGSGTQICAGAIVTANDLVIGSDLTKEHSGTITMGKDCHIHHGAIIAAYGGAVTLGDRVSVNPYTILYGDGGLTIGSGTRIAAHTVVVPSNHVYHDRSRWIIDQGEVAEGIQIGEDVWIGSGVRILDRVSVADGCVIGAGAVVTRDTEPYTVVAGVPARSIGSRG